MFFLQEITQRTILEKNFQFLGNQIFTFDQIDSTNSWLKKNCTRFSQNINVFARRQLQGRGRLEKHWIDQGNNFAFSMLLRQPAVQFQLVPIVVALAVYETLNHYIDAGLSIKWPNDILVEDKKISGILCESIDINEQKNIVIGVGINIKTAITKYPKELQNKIISLDMLTRNNLNTSEIAHLLLIHFDSLLSLLSEKKSAIIHLWNNLSQSLDRLVEFEYQQQKMHGKILGIDENGYLMIREIDSEKTIQLISGEVRFIKHSNTD